AARLGADAVETVPVTVFDTKQISLGAALLVITAAEMAAKGNSLAEITNYLTVHLPNTRLFGMLNTLDSLRRSGRVNWAEFGIGTLLQIKPVMMISDGAISVLAKVRTRKRALQYMLDQVARYGPFEKFVVAHVNAPEAAAKLKEMAMAAFPNAGSLPIMPIGPAVGTHLGLDAVGFACIGAVS
ncbi:MAG: DegV family protein, partial [Chloroflexi bacterium]